jgi:hypothetical protein
MEPSFAVRLKVVVVPTVVPVIPFTKAFEGAGKATISNATRTMARNPILIPVLFIALLLE